MRMVTMRTSAMLCGALFGISATAGGLSVDTRDNILKSASAVAGDLVALAKDGAYPDSPGRLSNYSYWEGAQVMSSLIDYWHKTNDSTFNDMARDAITFQAAEDTFMPANLRPSYLANEDQCLWALAAMLAAEDRFPEPSEEGQQWVSIAQEVYDMQKARIDEDKWCDGGLRWAIDASHHGWGTKNAGSNGCFFNLAARLARYTGDTKYSDTAAEIYDWMTSRGWFENWRVLWGGSTKDECKTGGGSLYLSMDGVLITQGAAFMYNITNGTEEWHTRVEKHTASVLKDFFPSDQAFEPDCELHRQCDTSERAYKGVNIRSLAVVTQLAPFTSGTILPALLDTTKAIAMGCRHGESGRGCQFYMLSLLEELYEPFPGDEPVETGISETVNALNAFSNLLIKEAAPPAVAPPPPVKSDSDGESDDGGDDSGNGNGSGGGSGDAGGGDSKKDDKSAGSRLLNASVLPVLVSGLLVSSWLL